jgi:hypothetical protein
MSATTSLLNVCPNIQAELDANWLNCHSRAERTPFLEYLLSAENTQPVKMEILPGGGKIKTVEVRYNQRLATSVVESNKPVTTCTGGDKRADNISTYTLDPNVNRQVKFSFDLQDTIRICRDNPLYLASEIERHLEVLRRAIWAKEAAALASLTGGWASDVSPVSGDKLQVKTLKDGTTDEVYPFTWEEIDGSLMQTGFCDAVAVFGSFKLWQYTRRVQAGCCANQGVDLRAIYQSYNRAMIWDREVQDALGDSDNAVAIQRGALQLLNFSLFEGWSENNMGANYFKQVITDPATGMKVDMIMSDNCGTVNVVLTATTKLIALPTDMFAVGDTYEGVNYVAQIEVANV